ncbi:hypothetical protein K788_00002100 [Paraburkholderia caribensis MBA4]|uniref:Uncharacterized protein n=2 Tax=Paraburkholderia caribensis TaxID=75105 RepID=A0A0N7JV91_9BURK|nr:hypothetical protein K788_00002100 [Paraburkholderia caribensis MBA4]
MEEVQIVNVRKLIAMLERAAPGSTVLFLDDYADLSESDEVFDVIIPVEPWTYECGKCDGVAYNVRYPETFARRDESYKEVTHEVQRVVLITNGPSNYRRLGLAERLEK